MTGRLILINKIYPKIPTINDARPITILSPVRRFLELHLVEKLKNFIFNGINKS